MYGKQRPKSDLSLQGCQKEAAATVFRRLLGGLCDAYYSKMIKAIETNQPEVKASKSHKRLQGYGHLKFCMIFHRFYLDP